MMTPGSTETGFLNYGAPGYISEGWSIILNGQIIASSTNPKGWSMSIVEVWPFSFLLVQLSVPSNAPPQIYTAAYLTNNLGYSNNIPVSGTSYTPCPSTGPCCPSTQCCE